MMTNLFMMFDPASSFMNLPLNWFTIMSIFLIFPLTMWFSNSRMTKMFKSMEDIMTKEMKAILPVNKLVVITFIFPVFYFILFSNMSGLLPFVFTSTSHMVVTLTLALPMVMAPLLLNWCVHTYNSFAHLLPQGTPPMLMVFMVIIESISLLIRPITLAVRLTANMVAGHILLGLLSSAMSIMSPSTNLMIMSAQILLFMLELAVAAIQAYVFTLLLVLYASE